MVIDQIMDLEIQIFKMVTAENGDGILGASLLDPKPTEYWDVHVRAYPEGFDNDGHIVVEIEDIKTSEQLSKVLTTLGELFPDAETETI